MYGLRFWDRNEVPNCISALSHDKSQKVWESRLKWKPLLVNEHLARHDFAFPLLNNLLTVAYYTTIYVCLETTPLGITSSFWNLRIKLLENKFKINEIIAHNSFEHLCGNLISGVRRISHRTHFVLKIIADSFIFLKIIKYVIRISF